MTPLSKSELRTAFRNALDALSVEAREVSTRALCERLILFLRSLGTHGFWAAFQPIGFEADIRPALLGHPTGDQTADQTAEQAADQTANQTEWVYPQVRGEMMRFLKPRAASSFVANRWGILEPDPADSTVIPLEQIQGFLVPALAFDLNCNRLGRGGGYYDRTLAELSSINPHSRKIGVALELQVSDSLFPTEDFDIPMDWVVTDKRSIERFTERKTS